MFSPEEAKLAKRREKKEFTSVNAFHTARKLGLKPLSSQIDLIKIDFLKVRATQTETLFKNQSSVCRTNFRFAHVRVYFDPARSKP